MRSILSNILRILFSCSLHDLCWNFHPSLTTVDASMHGLTSSFPSQLHYYHGFLNDMKLKYYQQQQWQQQQQQQQQQICWHRRRERKNFWLPLDKLFEIDRQKCSSGDKDGMMTKHILNERIFSLKLRNKSLLNLRGGGDKREIDTVDEREVNKKSIDSSKNKHQENEMANEASDSQEEKDIEQHNALQISSSFLSTPFLMNERARHEASMESVEEKEEISTLSSPSVSSIQTEGSNGHNVADDDRKEKRRNKNKMKKMGKLNKKTDTKKFKVEEVVMPVIDINATTVAIENASGNLSSQVDTDEDDDPKLIGATDNSNSWLDSWTQQLSDPEDMEEEEDDEYGDGNGDGDGDDIVSSGEEKRIKKFNNGKSFTRGPVKDRKEIGNDGERDQYSSSIIENLVNSDANVTISQATLNNATVLLDEELITLYNVTSTLYVSSGAWVIIDNMLTLGLASKFSSLRLSRNMRGVRKLVAHLTGLHGFLSRKPSFLPSIQLRANDTATETLSSPNYKEPNQDIHKRIAAIEKAREGVERAQAEEETKRKKGIFRGLFVSKEKREGNDDTKKDITEGEPLDESTKPQEPKIPQRSSKEIEEELQRMERVREIDRLISEGQDRLTDLICEKDVLQRRPNPLFDYTTTTETITAEIDDVHATTKDPTWNESKINTLSEADTVTNKIEIQASREMNFPPDDLVAEYLDMMISTRRLTKMNHTYLWKDSDLIDDDDNEESIGDDLFTASADAHRLYERSPSSWRNGRSSDSDRDGKKGGGGSWLLRQSIGGGPSLGEKIGQAAETAAYKAVTSALMSFLARALSSLHGINVLKHSDIRLVLEQSPDLPPVPIDGIIRGSYDTYAEDTIKTVMRRKTRRSKKRSKHRLSEDAFVQHDAVTETLLSHVQISAPLLKLFPLAWQRALLGNILTLSTALISDFVDGLHFQILGHQLSFAFRPITEVDMARHFQMAGGRFNQRRYKAAEFEAAVQATAEDLKEELKFLDSWHERALGSGVLRTQIANMIARIVLTLTDEVLSGARMDLWSAQAGGPRMLAGLEHRIEEES
mmetsp:Transcript_64213/g.71749  ORF Transcript_64213/g.71749 Transcript_64213/m.71749 type:complete len:1055 (+) Transcript_64213:108-3272(+)